MLESFLLRRDKARRFQMKIKGREVIKVSFNWTLDELYDFLREKWNITEYGAFEIGRPNPFSVERYIYLPATRNCLVIAFARKGKIIFSVADNTNGIKLAAATAIPTHNTIAKIYQSSLAVERAKEMRGPAAEICAEYAEYMKRLLDEAGLT